MIKNETEKMKNRRKYVEEWVRNRRKKKQWNKKKCGETGKKIKKEEDKTNLDKVPNWLIKDFESFFKLNSSTFV